MTKSILKELIIVLLLCLAIILVLGILLYEYVPITKTIPNQVAYTTPEDVKQELSEMKRLADMMNRLIVNTTRVKLSTLEDYINRKAEWYIDAGTALDLELCDGYY